MNSRSETRVLFRRIAALAVVLGGMGVLWHAFSSGGRSCEDGTFLVSAQPVVDGGCRTLEVDCLRRPLTVFPTVFDPHQDSLILASSIPDCRGWDVLDVGTGSGIQALAALERGARRVVATDINPAAVANARYNARVSGWAGHLDARLVSRESPGAYAVICPDERFDLVLSNPPFFDTDSLDARVSDAGHAFLRSILAGLRQHLKPGGKMLLVFWGERGLQVLESITTELHLKLTTVSSLALPGLTVPPGVAAVGGSEVAEGPFFLVVEEISPAE